MTPDMMQVLLDFRLPIGDLPPPLGLDSGVAGLAYACYLSGINSGNSELLYKAQEVAEVTSVYAEDSVAFRPMQASGPYLPYVSQSVLHGPLGFWMTRALAEGEVGREASCAIAVDKFVQLCQQHFDLTEFAFGSAGAIWGAARLLQGRLDGDSRCRVESTLRNLLAQTSARVLDGAEGSTHKSPVCVGFAHGEAGVLYAFLRALGSLSKPVPAKLNERLSNLACLATVSSRGLSWPGLPPSDSSHTGWPGMHESWCNGAAGFVPLWCLAYEQLSDDIYKELVLATSSFIATCDQAVPVSLCCGVAGHVAAFNYAKKLDPDSDWQSFMNRELEDKHFVAACLDNSNVGLLKGAPGLLLAGAPWL